MRFKQKANEEDICWEMSAMKKIGWFFTEWAQLKEDVSQWVGEASFAWSLWIEISVESCLESFLLESGLMLFSD